MTRQRGFLFGGQSRPVLRDRSVLRDRTDPTDQSDPSSLEQGPAGTALFALAHRGVAGALALALAALLSVAGCKPESPAGTAPAGPAAGGAAKRQIAGIVFQDDQFFKLIETGMKQEAAKEGVDLATGNSGNALDKEISLLDTYIAQRVDAIVIAPVSAKGSIPALKRAQDAGIKVVTYDSSIDADFPVANIKTAPESLGALTGAEAVRYIQEKRGGKATIAIVTYLALAPEPASKRTKGFTDAVSKLPGVKIVARQDAWLAPEAANVVESILTAHPDVDMVWAANEGGTVGAVTAVKNGGKAGKVVVFGTDISEQMADFLLADDNILQAVTGQKPLDIGAMAIATAVKAVKGETVEKQTALSGILYTRQKPDEVRKVKEYLHGLSR
jgi:sugar transport system substrate-binding protein